MLLSWSDQYMIRTKRVSDKDIGTIVVTLGGTEDGLVVMRETNKVDSIALRVVGVYFSIKRLRVKGKILSSFEVVECYTIVLTASYQVLAIVRDVD